MPAVRLGKMVLHWCDTCNISIISSKKCSICGNNTRYVKHTPPGDIRPAFDFDLELIKNTIDAQFGLGCSDLFLPSDKPVILNHAPDLDRLDEIIFDGQVQGATKYDFIEKKFKFLPRLSGAERFLNKISLGYVVVDDGAIIPICQGSNALAPGIVKACDGIEIGDELLVLNAHGDLLGVGSAQMASQDLAAQAHGVGVKIRWHKYENELMRSENDEPKQPVRLNNTKVKIKDKYKNIKDYSNDIWATTIKANQPVIDEMVESAKEFISRTIERFQLPVAVSFSGGKDSLATLLLVLESGFTPELFFIDTGLEFPETIVHVKEVSKKYGLNLKVGKPINTFWDGLDYFGPPGKDYRWCCKTCKLGPTTRLIKEHYPDGVLAFIGQRKYESEQRSKKGMVWHNPWVPGQVAASPIQHWSAMHIWLYIFNKKAEFNKLYTQGLERIGCWLCPASDLADLITVSNKHPDYNRWMEYLNDYSKIHSLTSFWIDHGIWRWKRLPKGIQQLLKDKEFDIRTSDKEKLEGIPAEKTEGIKPSADEKKLSTLDNTRGLQLYLADGFIDCKYGLSKEGMFNKELDLTRVANLATILGKSTYNKIEGFCIINDTVDIFRDGSIIVKGKTVAKIKKQVSKVQNIVVRALECISCGICIGRCENNALKIDESDDFRRIRVIEDQCTSCGKCLGPCPVVDFKAVETI